MIDFIGFNIFQDMENKEDYIGWKDQELCNRYYKEANDARKRQDWARLSKEATPDRKEQMRVGGHLGSRRGTNTRYVNVDII